MIKLFKLLRSGARKDACKECDYYNATNRTCASKKCATGNPYVTNYDRTHCEPYRRLNNRGEENEKHE